MRIEIRVSPVCLPTTYKTHIIIKYENSFDEECAHMYVCRSNAYCNSFLRHLHTAISFCLWIVQSREYILVCFQLKLVLSVYIALFFRLIGGRFVFHGQWIHADDVCARCVWMHTKVFFFFRKFALYADWV